MHTFGADRLDPQIKGSGGPRRFDAILDQSQEFFEDAVLRGDAQGEDAIEPAVDRRQALLQFPALVAQFQSGDLLEIGKRNAAQFALIKKMEPLDERIARELGFQTVGWIEKILRSGLTLAPGQRAERFEAPDDRAEKPSLAAAIGRKRAIDRRRHLVGAVAATEALYCRKDAKSQFEEKMCPAAMRGRAVPVRMHGPAGTARERISGDGFDAVLKRLDLEDIGAGAAPLDFLTARTVGDDAPGTAGDLGDTLCTKMCDQCVERGRNGRQSAQVLDQFVAGGNRLPA